MGNKWDDWTSKTITIWRSLAEGKIERHINGIEAAAKKARTQKKYRDRLNFEIKFHKELCKLISTGVIPDHAKTARANQGPQAKAGAG